MHGLTIVLNVMNAKKNVPRKLPYPNGSKKYTIFWDQRKKLKSRGLGV
jgi:hypothetical protein